MFFLKNIFILFFFGLLFLKIIKKLNVLIPNFYSPVLLFSYYVFEFCILIFLNIIDGQSNVLSNQVYEIKYNNLILPYACIILLIGCLFICHFFFLKYYCAIRHIKFISIIQRINDIEVSGNPNKILFFLALLFGMNIFSAFNLIYLIQALSLSFSFTPIIFGLFFRLADRKNKLLWFSVMILTFAFHIVQGSRGIAIIPFLLFFIGYLIQMNSFKSKVRLFLVLLFIGFPLLNIFGKISDYRIMFGRGVEISVDNFVNFADFLINGNAVEAIDAAAPEGLVRLLNHPDMAVIYLTPQTIDYRQFNYIFDEIQNTISLNGSSVRMDNYFSGHYGNSVAVKYGFSVNETTSVEFSLLADSYSRFGLLGIVIYYTIFTTLLFSLERITASAIFGNKIIALVFLMFILINSIYTLYAYNFWVFLKIIIFRGTFVLLIVHVFSFKKLLRR